MNNNKNNMERLAQEAGKAVGAKPDELKKAAESGDLNALLSKLSPQQAQQLRRVLSDEKAAKELLSSPQAQALMKSFGKK